METYCREIIENNPYVTGCAIAFTPYYYKDQELWKKTIFILEMPKKNTLKRGSASIWVVIPVPFHTTIEEFCSQDIGICPVEHAPLNCFGFIDSPLQ